MGGKAGGAGFRHRRVESLLDGIPHPEVDSQRELERRKEQSKRMEAIARLAGGIAHDFNNLLTAIMCDANLLERRLPAGPLAKSAHDITESALRGAAMTKRLMSVSRRHLTSAEALNLNEVSQSVSLLIEGLSSSNLQFTWQAHTEPMWVYAKPSHADEILANLIRNAAQQVGAKNITISLREEIVDSDFDLQAGRYAVVEIKDDGAGISPEALSRVFEPFVKDQGSLFSPGLELAITYALVRQHMGIVRAHSKLEVGNSFQVYLPIHSERVSQAVRPEPPLAAKATTDALPQDSDSVILLVEDTEHVRNVCEAALRAAGYLVLSAASAEEALGLVPDLAVLRLLVTDLVLPGANGFQLAALLQAEKPSLRCLFMSGYTDESIKAPRTLTSGEFLQKPFTSDVLSTKVREILAAPEPAVIAETLP